MKPTSAKANRDVQQQIEAFCKHVAGPCKIAAVCQSETYKSEGSVEKSAIEVLVVLNNFQPRLLSYVRVIAGRNVIFFAVDKWIFERDIDRGFLGEALARLLIFPYTVLSGGEYLRIQEVLLKKRLILELMENIALSYPELSYSMRIKPEYFMYEVMLNRVRVFPPLAYSVAPFLCREASIEKVETILSGYLEALRQIQKSELVTVAAGYVVLSSKFITTKRNPAMRLANQVKNAPRALFTSIFGVFPQLLNFLAQNSQMFFRFQSPQVRRRTVSSLNFIDPQEFILLPTSEGYVSLADKLDIRGFAKRILKIEESKLKVEEFGSYLNDIYLIKANYDHTEKRILVKRFKDLSSFKWFPLSIWSMGSTNFALLGRPRLERECAVNKVLAEAGFRVPKLLHVSANERLVFMEYLEGENLGGPLKRIASARNIEKVGKELEIIEQVGETYAKVHALGVVLGDTKPENVMISPQGEIYLLDFEQASRKGEKAWDVACFLYYCGHNMTMGGEAKAEAITNAFISGYVKAGGDSLVIKCASSPKYTRVFSIFTLPTILRVMSITCAKAAPKRF